MEIHRGVEPPALDDDALQTHLHHRREQLLAVAGQHLLRERHQPLGIGGRHRLARPHPQRTAQRRFGRRGRARAQCQPGRGIALGLQFLLALAALVRRQARQFVGVVRGLVVAGDLVGGREMLGQPLPRAGDADVAVREAFGGLRDIADQVDERGQLLLVRIVHGLEDTRDQLGHEARERHRVEHRPGGAGHPVDGGARILRARVLRDRQRRAGTRRAFVVVERERADPHQSGREIAARGRIERAEALLRGQQFADTVTNVGPRHRRTRKVRGCHHVSGSAARRASREA
ncbi:hypothetical protein DIE22_11530 [Burkholderia sp. Bp9142]|nr:hypothetical protein DIE22_11530 [Burkholderia sp. Bp9142]